MSFKNEIYKTVFYIIGVLLVAIATTAGSSYVRLNELEVKQSHDTSMIKENSLIIKDIQKDVKTLIFYSRKR